MKAIRWTLFMVMVLAQLAVPAYMIAGRERVLREGTAYKFRCGPVDPYDAFRGRYVALNFLDNRVENWKGPSFKWGDRVFAQLGVDDDGFAKIVDVTTQRPDGKNDYLEATVASGGQLAGTLWLRFSFGRRYYMDEFQAPAAEAAYRAQRRTEEGAHVVVRVREGVGVIEGLFFGDTSVEDYFQAAPKAE